MQKGKDLKGTLQKVKQFLFSFFCGWSFRFDINYSFSMKFSQLQHLRSQNRLYQLQQLHLCFKRDEEYYAPTLNNIVIYEPIVPAISWTL